jgi:hypothetical protein
VVATEPAGEFEGVANDAVRAAPGEDSLLHHDFIRGPRMQPAADLRVFPLCIFAHDPEVDVARVAVAQRRDNAREQPSEARANMLRAVKKIGGMRKVSAVVDISEAAVKLWIKTGDLNDAKTINAFRFARARIARPG